MKKISTILIMILVMLLLVSVSCGQPKSDLGGVPPETAVKGKLALVDGSFRVNQVPAGDSFLLIWPDDYTRQDKGGDILIIGPDDETVARVGDIVIIRGNLASATLAEKRVGPMLPEVARGPYWRVEKVLSSLPETGNLTQERINEIAEEYRYFQQMFDWTVCAEEHGITVKEAIGRFSLVDDAGLLGSVLEELEKETFAGLWLEGSQVIVAFTEDGEETVKDYLVEDSPLARRIMLRTFEVTLDELKLAQQEVSQLLQNHGLATSSHIDVVKNVVVLWITDRELFEKALLEAGAELPEYVVPSIVYEPADEPPSGINPDPSVHFPQLKTRSGSFMEALLVGELKLVDGYLRVGEELIIWQPDYFVHNNNGTIEIWDRDGVVVGRVGEEIYMGGGEIEQPPEDKFLKEPLPDNIDGPFWIQGAETRLNSDRE
jgi:hypothetical protein